MRSFARFARDFMAIARFLTVLFAIGVAIMALVVMALGGA